MACAQTNGAELKKEEGGRSQGGGRPEPRGRGRRKAWEGGRARGAERVVAGNARARRGGWKPICNTTNRDEGGGRSGRRHNRGRGRKRRASDAAVPPPLLLLPRQPPARPAGSAGWPWMPGGAARAGRACCGGGGSGRGRGPGAASPAASCCQLAAAGPAARGASRAPQHAGVRGPARAQAREVPQLGSQTEPVHRQGAAGGGGRASGARGSSKDRRTTKAVCLSQLQSWRRVNAP